LEVAQWRRISAGETAGAGDLQAVPRAAAGTAVLDLGSLAVLEQRQIRLVNHANVLARPAVDGAVLPAVDRVQPVATLAAGKPVLPSGALDAVLPLRPAEPVAARAARKAIR